MRKYNANIWNEEKQCNEKIKITAQQLISRRGTYIHAYDIAYILLNEALINSGQPELELDAAALFGDREYS